MANRRYIDFPIASTSGDTDIILIWQDGANKQTTKATFLSGLPENLDELNDVAISGLTNGQILRYDSVTGKWENTDQGNLDLNDLNDVSIVSPSNGQVLVYNSSTSKWENSSGGYVPYTGAVTTVNLGAQTIQAGQFVKAGGTAAQFLKADGSVDSNVYGTGTVTSVALTMPSAFNVANSPITMAGTLAVTGAGTAGQYIRGDGSLADFPQSSGGGSSVSYYLNGSVSQGTIGGVAYKELNKVPILGAGTDFTINADGYIASFLTDAGDPNLLEIPGGNWNFETYFEASSAGGTPSFYVELYKYDGTTFTLLASNSGTPEFIAFGTIISPYFSTLAVPTTTLALTDKLAVRYYVLHSGRTITMHTENNTLGQVITTFTTGLTSLNGLTAQVQNLAVGTSGTDFNIASAIATHTFNLPTASATNRGALSSTDWTIFNNKQNALTNPVTGTGAQGRVAYWNGSGTITSDSLFQWNDFSKRLGIGRTPTVSLDVEGAGFFSGTVTALSIIKSGGTSSQYLMADGSVSTLTNPVTGTGTTNYLPKFTGSTTIGNSQVFDNGTNVGIGTASPLTKLMVQDSVNTYVAHFSGLNQANGIAIGTNSSNVAVIQGYTRTFSATNNIAMQVDGGLVGIGTNTPSGKLDVRGSFRVTQDATHQMYVLVNSSYAEFQGIREDIAFDKPIVFQRQGGNVLIGTTSDNGARLQVSGTATISSTLTANGNIFLANDGTYGSSYITLGFGGTSNGSNRIFAGTSSSIDGIFIASATGRPISFRAGGGTTDHLIIASSGAATFNSSVSAARFISSTSSSYTNDFLNLNIGTVGQTIGLRFGYDGSTYNKGAIYFISKSANGVGDLIFAANNSESSANVSTSDERMRITSSGNVGIGTTSPTTKLDVRGLVASISGSLTNGLLFGDYGSDAGTFLISAVSGRNIVIRNEFSGAELLRINGNGNVLIGTTTDSGYKTTIAGAGGFLWATNGSANSQFFLTSGNNLIITNANSQGVILNNGATSWSTYSDIRLKNVNSKIENVLEKLTTLTPINFTWKNDYRKKETLGLIAQELEKVFPQVVEVNDDNNKTLSVKYSELIPVLVSAIQELKQEIDTLKN